MTLPPGHPAYAERRRQERILGPLGFICCYCGQPIAPDDLADGYGTNHAPRHSGKRRPPYAASLCPGGPFVLTDAELEECKRIAAARPERACVTDGSVCVGSS